MDSSRCTGGSDRNNHLGRWLVDNMPRGIELEVPERRDAGFARALSTWLDNVVRLYSERLLAVDLSAARRWSRLAGAHGHESADLLIAATAFEHGLTVVTRNVRHFEPTGVPVLDPSGADR